MAKQNFKSAKKPIDKKQLATQLETISKNVAKRGMFFAAKNKQDMYDVVDARTQNPVLQNVVVHEVAQLCASKLNKTSEASIKHSLAAIQRTLAQYQAEIDKYYNDIFFYKYTLSTTEDDMQYSIVESRLDLATQRLSNLIRKIRSIFY